MKKNIIGREHEIACIEKYVSSPRSELIAVYGRRRVGKTFLIKEMLDGRFTFRTTGKENASTKEQLANFCYAFGNDDLPETAISDWEQAFALLARHIERNDKGGPKILFFDELPWFDTYGSRFLSALEHFWNDWAIYRNDIKLFVCGSATTWMLDEVINSRGGLHNRVTHTMLLAPFTLHETEEYFRSRGFSYERPEIMECYMAVGGVAYYLSLFEQDKSVAQNIESLCFTRGGELRGEHERVFKSLFKRANSHIEVVTALHKKGMGMTRQEIILATKLLNNGNLTRLLNELEACDFIRSYTPFGKKKKEKLYQLIDPFTLFYFRFMRDGANFMKGHWQKMQTTGTYRQWCGYAFEILCLNHLEQIVHALGIDGTINLPCSWNYRPGKKALEEPEEDADLKQGAQIDLLIDRSDHTINVCEMKYSMDAYEITKAYDATLGQRMRTFKKVTKTRKTLVPAFITPFGLYNNMYSRRVPRVVTIDDLFIAR